MKIYAIALAIFIFIGFSSVVTAMGVFGSGIYSHTNEVSFTVNQTDIEGIEKVSGQDVLSESEMQSSNPDTGGLLSFIPGYSIFIKTIKMALNVDQLIMEYVPPSSTSLVQPFADFMNLIMWLIYGIGIVSFLRRYKVD